MGRKIPGPNGPNMRRVDAAGKITGKQCHLLVVPRVGEDETGLRTCQAKATTPQEKEDA